MIGSFLLTWSFASEGTGLGLTYRRLSPRVGPKEKDASDSRQMAASLSGQYRKDAGQTLLRGNKFNIQQEIAAIVGGLQRMMDVPYPALH